MDSNVIFDQKVILGFTPVLTYAACEWFLIFLMFIDALLSYLLVWFARYCRLQMPCFLCSKLLHPLHWRFLICRDHRTEVSSFMSCQNHDNNLADCRGMCDDCLLSFTRMPGPNPDMNRMLLGKLGYDLLSTNHFSHPRSCSCCKKPWRTRHQTQRLIRLGTRGKTSGGRPNIPTPRNLSRRGSLIKMKDNKGTSGSECVEVGSRSDGMPHVGYSELKINSDSESEYLFSDDEAFLKIIDFRSVETSEKRSNKSRSRKSFEGKKRLNRKQPYPSQEKQDKKIKVEDYETAESSLPERDRVDDIKKQRYVEPEEHEAVLTELITMSEARPFLLGVHQEDNAGTSTQYQTEAEASANSSPSAGEFLSPSGEKAASREIQFQESAQNISSDSEQIEASEAATEQKESNHIDVLEPVADESSSDEEDGVEEESKPLMEDGVEEESRPLMSSESSVSLARQWSNDEEKEVHENNVAEEYFSNEEDLVNGHSEQSTSKDVSGSFAKEQSSEDEEEGSNGYSVARSHSSDEEHVDTEDSKQMTSNNVTDSATEEHSGKREHVDPEETEPLVSPKISNKESSLEHSDRDSSSVTENHSTSNGSPELKHSASVESFVSISSDMEGENLVSMLKQQLERERKCLRDLTKELEEERNASAVATNQAMAMITRLQEEKAALRMEALQYLRMMDEQAEHDVDALERANDVLADREKEMQDLEMELEYYRAKYPDESRDEILASMGILGNTETSGTSITDQNSYQAPIDAKPVSSQSPGN